MGFKIKICTFSILIHILFLSQKSNTYKLLHFHSCFLLLVGLYSYSTRNKRSPVVLSHVLPGCVWDWSRPTLWLLQREILRADWCLVARRLGHLGRGRHCCRGTWSRVTAMVKKVQESIHPDKIYSTSITVQHHQNITDLL